MLTLRSRNAHPFFRSVDLAEKRGGERQDPKPGTCRAPVLVSRDAGERLESWKEIASHLNRTVRTVQRWEKCEGLPVHRHTHLNGTTVYGFKTDIDIWLTGRGQTQSEAHPMEKHSKYTANGLNPPTYLMRQMFAAFRIWLAIGRAGITSNLWSERKVRSRQVVTNRGCRALSLAPFDGDL